MINNFASSYQLFPMMPMIGLGVFTFGAVLIFLLIIGLFILKGYALWVAARRDDRGWFVALLIINTVGILELVYLYFVADVWHKNQKTTIVPEPKVNEPGPDQKPH